MTFTEIVSRISKRLNQTSAASLTRIGESVNDVYKAATASIGLSVTRRTEVQANANISSQYVTFTGVEKVISVIDKSTGQNRFLDEVTVDELDRGPTADADTPTKYAIYRSNAGSVQIKLNAVAQTAYTLYAPAYILAPTLSGTQEPAFPESFHDVLVSGGFYEEYMKLEKPALAMIEQKKYEDRMGDLRLFIATSPQQDIYQGKLKGSAVGGSISGASGGSGSSGATSYTQTGLITFDRTSQPVSSRYPFAVAAGSEKVANLDADLLDGLDSTAFRLTSELFDNADIAAAAGITYSKLNLAGGIVNADVSAAAAIAYTKLNLGTSIVNADIAVAAAIAWTKVSKTGSSLAELTTRSAADLSSGIIPAARLGTPFACEGRLTLTSGTPVTTTDVPGATTVYFTPYKGNRIALYDGAAVWTVYAFTEKSVALGTLTNDLPYDVFIYDNAGTPALEILAWSSKTARATALTTQDGVLVKTGATTRRYLGTFHTTAATTTEDSAAKRLLWNYYNRVRRSLLAVDTTNTWNYTTATFRQANGSTANQVAVIVGVAESAIDLRLLANAFNTATGVNFAVAIGEDSTSTPSTTGLMQIGTTYVIGFGVGAEAQLTKIPAAGYHFYAWLEFSVAAGTTTWQGDGGVTYQQNGLTGSIEN